MAGFSQPVRVRPSEIAEPEPRGKVSPRGWVRKLALLKARHVARTLREGLVLGVDTVVHRDGKIFGKPRSRSHARRMLSELSGRWHTVYTGVALSARPGKREWSGVWSTRVKMRSLSERELDYWSARNHDKAGTYAVQARGGPFVETLRGDYDTVVGLPRRGVKILLARARAAGFRPR